MRRRRGQHIALAIGSILFGSLVARAYDTSWIAPGQSISAAKLKADLDELKATLDAAQTRIAALEKPVAVAYGVPTNTIPANSSAILTFAAKGIDNTNGAYHPSSGTFVAPAAGIYRVSFFAIVQGCSADINQGAVVELLVNGTSVGRLDAFHTQVGSFLEEFSLHGESLVGLSATDAVNFQFSHSCKTSASFQDNSNFSIVRVGG